MESAFKIYPPSESNDNFFNKAFDCIRAFELEQMYSVLSCSVCHEARIDMRYVSWVHMLSLPQWQITYKNVLLNDMNPGKVPNELSDLSIVEKQIICP